MMLSSDMDKEDALICFEEVIKEHEKEEQERQERKKVLQKRHFRKNREKFNVSRAESATLVATSLLICCLLLLGSIEIIYRLRSSRWSSEPYAPFFRKYFKSISEMFKICLVFD